MELTNEFRVGVPVPEAWKVLTDVERIAPLMPGARLQEVEGDEYRGTVKVKVGPITAEYKGKATFEERDEAAGRVVLRAAGRDSRGQGNANALITATMTPDGAGTKVSVVTDLTVSGKVAQFGRGVLAEVSGKLLGQFVDALEADMEKAGTERTGTGGGDATASTGTTGEGPSTVDGPGAREESSEPVSGNGAAASSEVRRIEGPDAEPVDLFAVAGGSTLKRLAPLAIVALVILFVVGRRRVRQRAQA
jgi:carbon monoxide dehydrogenase subunit G